MEAVRKNEGAELKPEESWTEDDELQIIDTIERWAEKELKPIAMKYDQADEYPHEVVEQMKELGLFGATVSPQYGGLGLSATTYAKIVSAVCRVWMAPTGIFNSHLILANCVERFVIPFRSPGTIAAVIGGSTRSAASTADRLRCWHRSR